MTYHVHRNDVPEAGLGSKGGAMETRLVYGKDMSMMYAERPEDYHSKPHAHDSEQFNYIISGEIWIFIEDEAMLLTPGDFNRIPELAIHWSKVESGPCVMVEAHCPAYVADEELAGKGMQKAIGMFGPDEEGIPVDASTNIWAAESYAENETELIEAYRQLVGTGEESS